MAVQYIDNLSYKGKKPNFERDQFKTLAEMKAFSEADIDEGHSSYCLEDGKRYTFKSSNSVDSTTGRWRVENNPGGGVVREIQISQAAAEITYEYILEAVV